MVDAGALVGVRALLEGDHEFALERVCKTARQNRIRQGRTIFDYQIVEFGIWDAQRQEFNSVPVDQLRGQTLAVRVRAVQRIRHLLLDAIRGRPAIVIWREAVATGAEVRDSRLARSPLPAGEVTNRGGPELQPPRTVHTFCRPDRIQRAGLSIFGGTGECEHCVELNSCRFLAAGPETLAGALLDHVSASEERPPGPTLQAAFAIRLVK